tara:strand:+ start:181 stop:507 length:327 start_codon:yes stop_codon:yes gene_type:complete
MDINTTHSLVTKWELDMKITFEFESSYKGKLVIDGKEFEIIKRPGEAELKAPEGENLDETLGGIIANELFGKFSDVMRAWSLADDIDCNVDMWTALSEEAGNAAYQAL